MADPEGSRKLMAILAADAAGYSRLMQIDDRGTVATLDAYRAIFREHIEAHEGRIVDMAGDSILAVFDSPTEAVRAAVEIQSVLAERNKGLLEERRMRFRIGVNLGEVISKADGTVYGDGVNIAARLESIGEPGSVTVSGTVFDQVKNRLQVGFDFIGEQHVKNIAEPVRTYRVRSAGTGSPQQLQSKARPTTRRWIVVGSVAVSVALVAASAAWYAIRTSQRSAPAAVVTADQGLSVAVLPFENLSGDSSQEFFADGITDEIINTLFHFQSLRVAPRNNTFRYKGKAVDTRVVGNELRVRYVLAGSVRKTASAVRVTAQLVQAESGAQIWSETYERPLSAKNVFDIQQGISLSIATAIGGGSGALLNKEYAESQSKPPANLTAYECFMRWNGGYIRTLSKEDHHVAVDCLELAVESDPTYADFWAALANVYYDEYRFGYDPRPGAPLDRALKAAQRAVQLAPQSQRAYWHLAQTRYFRGERDAFLSAADRSIQLNPNEPNALAALGTWVCYAGQWDKGIAMVNKALALDPWPSAWYYFPVFFDRYRKRDYEGALAAAQKIDMPDFLWAHAVLVAAYGQLGRTADAQPSIKRILDLDPDFEATAREKRLKLFRYQVPLLDQFMDGLRKAGLKIPEKKA